MQLRRGDTRWGAAGGEQSVRRMTNSIRPAATASLLPSGEAQTRGKGESDTLRGSVIKRCWRDVGDWRRNDWKVVHVNQGDLAG
jgi:hypothetical protein